MKSMNNQNNETQLSLFDLEVVPLGMNSLFLQEINQDFLFYLLGRALGKPLNEQARSSLQGVKWLEDAMERITESNLHEELFIVENTTSKGRLGEFYVAFRTEKRLPPITNQAGFDLLGTFIDGDKAAVGKVQVKTSGPDDNSTWSFQITDKYGKINYDVLVAIGLKGSHNPCKADIFVIPRSVLITRVAKWKKPVVDIRISKNRIHNRSMTKLNKYWEYHLPSHYQLSQKIAEYVCSDNFVILSSYIK